jgi:uncharacterized secreted protein with C-terminal beta-propeller domain
MVEIMKAKVLFLVLLLGMVISVAQLLSLSEIEVQRRTRLRKFSSYEELKNFVEASWKVPSYYPELSLKGSQRSSRFALSAAESGGASASVVPDFSATNIQVEGVDEADIVKTDGEFLYIISENKISILKAYPAEEAEVLSQITLNGTLEGIFINGDRLALFENPGDYFSYSTRTGKKLIFKTSVTKTSVKVYDVSDRSNPVLKRSLSVDGHYFNSRMIGDYVYLLTNKAAYSYNNVTLPRIYSEDKAKEIDASTVYYSSIPDYHFIFTTIVAINMQNDEQEPTYESFLLGAARTLYVSRNNIYITLPDATLRTEIPPLQTSRMNTAEWTSIHRVVIENGEIEYVASGKVPGRVLNQFSMDEHDGYFRIATTTGHFLRTFEGASSQNNVYVLDRDLKIVGRLENLAPGERIYSARFMGDRCYLVTFKKVDPLFVIDLKNPSAPRVLGQLKITGYSDYLHPYDENHIIGVGKETVAAEEGDFAWYQGVKISLFDVSNVSKPKEIDKYIIGDRGTDSPVLRDHKAFLFDKAKRLLVIPVLVAEIDEDKYPYGVPPNTFGDFVWQGAYVFDISLEEGLVLKGGITHLENDSDLAKSGYYFFSPYAVKRALYIDNVLYTVSDKKIKMNSLETLDEINEVTLP